MTVLNENYWLVFMFWIVYICVHDYILFVLCDIPGARKTRHTHMYKSMYIYIYTYDV